MMLAFESIDVDGSGSIDVSELFEYLQEARTTFTDALFALMGEPCPCMTALRFESRHLTHVYQHRYGR
jgi:hypothetical protein